MCLACKTHSAWSDCSGLRLRTGCFCEIFASSCVSVKCKQMQNIYCTFSSSSPVANLVLLIHCQPYDKGALNLFGLALLKPTLNFIFNATEVLKVSKDTKYVILNFREMRIMYCTRQKDFFFHLLQCCSHKNGI